MANASRHCPPHVDLKPIRQARSRALVLLVVLALKCCQFRFESRRVPWSRLRTSWPSPRTFVPIARKKPLEPAPCARSVRP